MVMGHNTVSCFDGRLNSRQYKPCLSIWLAWLHSGKGRIKGSVYFGLFQTIQLFINPQKASSLVVNWHKPVWCQIKEIPLSQSCSKI